jgi:alcohol dehydrogenase
LSRRERAHAAADETGSARTPNLTPLLTHSFPLDRINQAYEVFAERRNSVIKVAIRP